MCGDKVRNDDSTSEPIEDPGWPSDDHHRSPRLIPLHNDFFLLALVSRGRFPLSPPSEARNKRVVFTQFQATFVLPDKNKKKQLTWASVPRCHAFHEELRARHWIRERRRKTTANGPRTSLPVSSTSPVFAYSKNTESRTACSALLEIKLAFPRGRAIYHPMTLPER